MDAQRSASAIRLMPSLTYRRRAFSWRQTVPTPPMAAATGYEIHLTQPGSIANLSIRPQQMPYTLPPLNEATTAVQAAGLNFRDVLNVLGLDPTGTVRLIGGESAGIVSTVGPACGHVLPSERAYGLVPGSLRTHARCDARYIRCVRAWFGSRRRDTVSTSLHLFCVLRFSFMC